VSRLHDLTATLVAVATPPGRGGVGCVRLSGPRAHELGRIRFDPASSEEPRGDGRARFGRFRDREGRSFDHGYLVLFPGGSSFTGEETAELWPHGSPAVLAELVAAAVADGAVPAGPGEFTYRALRRGRIDLARAEAVRDLVRARTAYQARVAFRQADGALSRRLAPLADLLEEWIARGEAAVEFVDESDVHLPPDALSDAIARARGVCRDLLHAYGPGRVVRDGATVALVGSPNVGKSSLFNRLLTRDRAIVTPIPGTTRDTLEDELDLDGIPVRVVDTAGLREAGDPVEREGVRRAESARADADAVLLVLDASREPDAREREEIERVRAEAASTTWIVWNKADLAPAHSPPAGEPAVSALTGAGIDALRTLVRERLAGPAMPEDPILTDARHASAVASALASLERAARASREGWSEEIVLEEMREALGHVGTITGERTQEDLYDRIFSTFCIGK
jgi:tRNA modification GTPase